MMANLLIAGSEPLARRELKITLADIGHTVVGEAASGEQALFLARSLRPDAVLLDILLSQGSSGGGGGDALVTARALSGERLGAVLVLGGPEAPPAMIRRAGEAGVLAFLRRPLLREQLEPAIPIAVTRFREIVALEAEVRGLTERMEARKQVGRAKAILMEQHGLSEREAFKRIQTQSQTLNKPTDEIARAIITASEVAPGAEGAMAQ